MMLFFISAGTAHAIVPPFVIRDDTSDPPPSTGGACTLIGSWDSTNLKCTLNQDITLPTGSGSLPYAIDVQSDGITIDGAGHTITGFTGVSKTGTGVAVYNRSSVSVVNLNLNGLYYGIELYNSFACTILDDSFTGSYYGLYAHNGTGAHIIARNEFTNNDISTAIQQTANSNIYANDFFGSDIIGSNPVDINLVDGDTNAIWMNNFLTPTDNIYLDANSTGNTFDSYIYAGNYWAGHATTAQGCINADNNFTCDSGYTFDGSHTDTKPLARRRMFFSWYDSASPGAQNWVLMANPAPSFNFDSWFDLVIGGVQRNLPALAGSVAGEVPAHQLVTPSYPGLIGGPVEVGYHGISALVSQRTLWAGNSLEEVIGTDASRLSSHYWWTWYDMQTPGYKDWVLISNPNDFKIFYRVKIAGSVPTSTNSDPASGELLAGASVTPNFAGVIGGPVEVEAWSDSIDGTQVAFYASQRVLSNGDTAFNEVPGVGNGDLSDHYVWTWYDEVSPGAFNWIMIANPTHNQMDYSITIAGDPPIIGTVGDGGYAYERVPGKQGGPVDLKTYYQGTSTPLRSIASQRVIWGPSFEEVPGLPFDDIGNSYHWTWYDQQTAGMTNWVLVASPPGSVAAAAYDIKIGETLMDLDGASPGQQGDHVYPDDIKYYTFPGTMGGPVSVVSDNPVISSQRVLHNGFFNEVMGTPPS